jgi:DNA-binding NarL/FixJ family response regulator
MSQWGVQLVIGKLITDEEFRRHFQAHGAECLHVLRRRGIELDDTDIAALVGTDPSLWARTATRIDHRLRKSVTRTHKSLTSREQKVLRGVFEGLTNKEIADQVGASESAIKATIQHLFRKAHVRRRTQLVRIAIEGELDGRKTP